MRSQAGVQFVGALGILILGVGLAVAGDSSSSGNNQPAIAIRLIDPNASAPPAAAVQKSTAPAAPLATAPAPTKSPVSVPAKTPTSVPAKAPTSVPVHMPKATTAPAATETKKPAAETAKTPAFQFREPGRISPRIDGLGETLNRVPTADKIPTAVKNDLRPAAQLPAPRAIMSDKAASAPQPATKPNDLKPIPEETQGPVEVEAASFKGVTPGATSAAELEKTWGVAKEIRVQGDDTYYLYSVGPFNRVEVTCRDGKVMALAIRFDQPLPAAGVAKQLGLGGIRPVLVSNELGEILGQAYPERGVLLAFEPAAERGQASMKASQIILEPLSAETFVLRAETLFDVQPVSSLEDLEQALKLQPNVARAHWLRARLLAEMSDFERALTDCDEAVRLEPNNAQYRLTRAQVLGQAGRVNEAVVEAQRAIDAASRRPHIKARGLSLLGDLVASEPSNDYKRAIGYHMEAINTADALMNDRYPAIRVAAKEVLVDAHLGAAHDVAWGSWKDKDKAIVRWVERAKALADDLIKNDGASEVFRLRVYTRAVAASVGARGAVDPHAWTDEALRIGKSLIAATEDPMRKAQFQWDVGMALYDALQVHQMRGEHDIAIRYGEKAIEYLEKGQPRERPAAAYLLGRLYFRIGAVYALRDQNHRTATTWFDKAVPLLQRPLPAEAAGDLGRHGETFVSMGVSYWETGQRERAVELTQRGVELISQAVKQGQLTPAPLVVGYSNLAAMHRAMGKPDTAERYEALSARLKHTQQR
jgi:tetratricopeptide (TPR) repeat protein